MFLPVDRNEMCSLGYTDLDIVLISGDAYIDSPYCGIAMIGHVLTDAGFRVGIVAQPTLENSDDILRLGLPALFFGVSGGNVDSMVANYTATRKPRRNDDFTPGGENNRRPDRAVIAYSNAIRRFCGSLKPIVIGGIEASLRRIAHYDYWSDKVRRSILQDSKANYLLYGMAERSVVELAIALRDGQDVRRIKGLCYRSNTTVPSYLVLPDYREVAAKPDAFAKMFDLFKQNAEPGTARGLVQKQESDYLVQNPPADYLSQSELDHYHDLPFERAIHPQELNKGGVRAVQTIRFSIPATRGCYGECSFCAISLHQGRRVVWRSVDSIVGEVKKMVVYPDFKGYILDVGGPTANMYGFECRKKISNGACQHRRCLYPEICSSLEPNHLEFRILLARLRSIEGLKKIFIASGLRHDLILADESEGKSFLEDLVEHHISGQLKLAPEHAAPEVLALMGKPPIESLTRFKKLFDAIRRQGHQKCFLTYYLIAAHPGSSKTSMAQLRDYCLDTLGQIPEQVQIFTPTPSTEATMLYHLGYDPKSGRPLAVERSLKGKQNQKDILLRRKAERQPKQAVVEDSD